MSNKYVQPGEIITWTNGTGADVDAGDVVAVGDRIGVCVTDIDNGDDGAVRVQDVVVLAAKSADDWSDGDYLWWDPTNEQLTDSSDLGDGCIGAGYAVGDKAALATTANVALAPGGNFLNGDTILMSKAGSPTDGTSGDGAGYAGTGSLLIDTTNAKLYINTNTKASPAWTVVGAQTT